MVDKQRSEPATRRNVLKNGLLATATLTLGTGLSSAKQQYRDWDEFERLFNQWLTDHGSNVEKNVLTSSGRGGEIELLIEYVFSDGVSKQVLTKTKGKYAYAVHDQMVYRTLRSSFASIRTQSGNVKDATDPGVLPGSPTVSGRPTIDPGQSYNTNNGNGGQTWESGFGVEEGISYPSSFVSKGYSAGAGISWVQAGAQTWFEFEAGNDGSSPYTTLDIDVDYYWKAHTAVANGGASELVIQVFFHDVYAGQVYEETSVLKSSSYYDLWDNSKSDSANFQREASAGSVYRVGVHVDTTALAAGAQLAKADVSKDGTKYAEVTNVDVNWV